MIPKHYKYLIIYSFTCCLYIFSVKDDKTWRKTAVIAPYILVTGISIYKGNSKMNKKIYQY